MNRLADFLSALEVREGRAPGATRILSVATETAASLLTFHTYLENLTPRLAAMTWGGEDLAAALGASDNRNPATGEYDDAYLLAKSLCLATARAVGAQPVGVVYVNFRDTAGLMGINQAQVIMLTFVIASAFAGTRSGLRVRMRLSDPRSRNSNALGT